MYKIKKQLGAAGGGMVVLGIMIICLGLSIMGVRNYYLLESYKTETIKFIPSGSEVYSCINFYPVIWQLKNINEENEPEELKELRRLMKEFEENNKINLEEILLEWIEPEISLSLFSTERLYYYGKALANLDRCKKEIRTIAGALESYYEKNGKYPKKMEELLPDYLEKLPEGAEEKYIYRAEEEGQVFILEAWEDLCKDAGVTGKYPAYRGEKGVGDLVPCTETMPETAYPEWLIVGAIKDREKLNSFISEKPYGEAVEIEYRGEKIITLEKAGVSYCLSEKSILVSDSEDLIKLSLDVRAGEKENIEGNELYREFKEKMVENSFAFTFFDLNKILPHIYKDFTEGIWLEAGTPVLKGLKSFGIIASANAGGVKVDTYLNIDKENESSIIKLVMKQDSPELSALEIVPEDITMLYSSGELKVLWQIIEEMLIHFPGLNDKYEAFHQMFAQFTQVDIEKDIIENLSGEITMSVKSTPEYLEGVKKISEVDKCKNSLALITGAVMEYQEKNEGTIPEKPEDLVPEYLTEVPEAPGDGKYIIAETEEETEDIYQYPPFYTGYSGTMGIPEIAKGYPRYYSDMTFTLGTDDEGNEIHIPLPFPDNLIILGIKDAEALKKLITLACMFFPGEKSEKTFRGLTYTCLEVNDNKVQIPRCISYLFTEKYFILTTGKTKAPMEKTIDTLRKNQKSILENRDYKIAIKNIPGNNPVNFSFVNLKDFMEIAKAEGEFDKKPEILEDKMIDFSEKLSYAWSSTNVEKDCYHWSLFIPLNFK